MARKEIYRKKNGEHSTESAHERYLFTSSDTSNPSELFNASQLVNKNRSSTFHGMMFLFHTYWDFFSLTDTFQRLEANDRGNTSLVRSETRTIVLRSVNLPLYEINYILWPQNVHLGYSGGGTKASLSKKNPFKWRRPSRQQPRSDHIYKRLLRE